jgi:DNA modification methylase
MPADSVHCCVTSPPYWGLRDYGTPPQIWGGDPDCRHRWGAELKSAQRLRNGDGASTLTNARRTRSDKAKGCEDALHPSQGAFCQRCGAWRGSLGLEPDYRLYVAHLVGVLREVRRVLRPDGTLWLNLGDCYAMSTKGAGGRGKQHTNLGSVQTDRAWQIPHGLKPKDLVGIPWRVAFALQDDGWWLRRDNVWAKRNPMPESCKDRCTSSHEYLFHLTKSARYFYDAEAIKEPNSETSHTGGRYKAVDSWKYATVRGDAGAILRGEAPIPRNGRNKRSVWSLATAPFPEAHFATFPPALVEPCILAGTSARGVCPSCAAPWERVVEKVGTPKQQTERQRHLTAVQVSRTGGTKTGGQNSTTFGLAADEMPESRTIGWRPTCSCNSGGNYADPIPATVLDPFLGSGTTALVAERLGRHCIGLELSPAYAEMAHRRTAAQPRGGGLDNEARPPRTLGVAA